MIAVEDGKKTTDAEIVPCPNFEPTMSLAIGEQAIGMRSGLRYGREVKQRAFGRALGIDGKDIPAKICRENKADGFGRHTLAIRDHAPSNHD